MAETTAAEDLQEGEAPPPAGAAAEDRPLRLDAVDLALTRPAAFDALLDEDELVPALRVWYGARLEGSSRGAVLTALDRDIAAIDALLSAQVDAILHHPRFQRLEAAWRGVVYLVDRTDSKANIKVKLLDAAWSEVCRDLERASEFDQSQMFQKIYEEEFGTPGGEPFGLMIGDYEIRHRPGPGHPTDDVAGLTAMSQVAAASFCPFIVGAEPAMFGLDDYDDITVFTDMVGPFRQAEYERWRAFQKTEDARFVAVVAPRVLVREPWGDDPGRWDGFCYRETATTPGSHLWGSAAFAFGGVVMRAYSEYRWSADIRGVQTDADAGGLVADLPALSFATDRPGLVVKYPTAAYLTERQENDLCEFGFLPLANCQYTPYSAFFGSASVQRPQAYDGQAATINARMSAMMQYVLCVSRFTHYIKVMARDWVGSFSSPDECEQRLLEWLRQYCTANDDSSYEFKAQYPLREAEVSVRELPGAPGLYGATIHLKPHFQLDQIVSSFKLVTTLPGKTAA